MNQQKIKYPRTPHLPWSPGNTSDDIVLESIQHLESLPDIIVTEKLDGENTTLYRDGMHARSIDSRSHPSRDWLKQLHARIRFDIPWEMRICGENVYARHSIFYDRLETYYYVFAIFEKDVCLPWDETIEWCELIGLKVAPLLYRGKWDEGRIRNCWTGVSRLGPEQEGYVVRNADHFLMDKFGANTAKYVRAAHVTNDEHWMTQELVPNQLLRPKI